MSDQEREERLQGLISKLDDARKQIEFYRAAESWARDDYRKLEAKLAEMGSELDRWRELLSALQLIAEWPANELSSRECSEIAQAAIDKAIGS